jgi:predicted NAD-dependent protein-ADP-ribosyltransferase YbiA (DUF1768 family)
MLIFRDNAQPFGLLSIHAYSPLEINHILWKTANEYIYVNAIPDEEYKQKMRMHLFPTPFPYYQEILDDLIANKFSSALAHGTKLKLEQHPTLKNILHKFTSVETQDNFPGVEAQINKEIAKLNIVGLSFHRLARLIDQVKKELKKGTNIPEDSSIKDLMKYEVEIPGSTYYESLSPLIKYDPTRSPEEQEIPTMTIEPQQVAQLPILQVPSQYERTDPVFQHLNMLIPYLKAELKLKNSKEWKDYEREVQQFKDHLLRTSLEHILKTEYPHLSPDMYNSAIAQQLAVNPEDVEGFRIRPKEIDRELQEELEGKMPELRSAMASRHSELDPSKYGEAIEQQMEANKEMIDDMKDALYQSYLAGEIEREVLDELSFEPRERPKITLKKPKKILYLEDDDVLMPLNEKFSIKSDGKKYKSVLRYGYQKLFDEFNIKYDANIIPIDELPRAFESGLDHYIRSTLIGNAEQVLHAKFAKYSEAFRLLEMTRDQELIWNDVEDPILGSGGENVVGKILMKIRMSKLHTQRKSMSEYKHFTDNLFFRQWILMRMGDLVNTYFSLTSLDLNILQDIYKCPLAIPQELSYRDRQVIRDNVNVSDKIIKQLWRLVFPQIYPLFKFYERDALDIMFKAQEKFMRDATTFDKENVFKYFSQLFTKYSDKIRFTNAAEFTGTIVSGHAVKIYSKSTMFSEANDRRIVYWADLNF